MTAVSLPRVVFIFALCAMTVYGGSYKVTFTRLNNDRPVISSQTPQQSDFKWNYNTAVVPDARNDGFGLLVRAQNQANPNDPWTPTPSVMPFTRFQGTLTNLSSLEFEPITAASVVFEPQGDAENFGVEDPRIVYRAKTGDYILLYTAAQAYPNGTTIARLAMAVTKTPTNKESWKRLGPLFPELGWSKSGALLLRDDVSPESPHFLIFGDSAQVPGLQIAVSKDLRKWRILPGVFLPERKDGFDCDLMEAGPMPLRLSDGNYLFIYNSARHNFTDPPKPDYDYQYNVGWAVLDAQNPAKVIERCDKDTPLLTPELGWERGFAPWLGLTPNVVFLEGWIPLPKPNTFLAFYGGADSVIGAGIISVDIIN